MFAEGATLSAALRMLHCQITSHKQSLIVGVYVATWPALSPRLATAQWLGGLCNVNIFYWGIHWGCKRSAVYVSMSICSECTQLYDHNIVD
jgi:hypothetical protein